MDRKSSSVFIVVVVVSLLALLQVNCAPLSPTSPCPRNFLYEFDGQQWNGVVIIQPEIYNHFRIDHIRVNVILAVNYYVSNAENFNLLPYETQDQIYLDMAAHRPIRYRIRFQTFVNGLPALKSVLVNGLQVCENPSLFRWISEITLQYKFYLPKTDSPALAQDSTGSADVLIPDIPRGNIDVPSQLLTQRNDRLPSATSECGTYDENLKYTQLISGGEKILAGTWPWLVAIFHKDSKASDPLFQCTGSLISHRLVLTVAHCFKIHAKADVIVPKRILLAFGRHDIRDWTEKNVRSSNAQEIILHPDYLSKRDSTIFEADLAIVVTKDLIEYTTAIRPICLWPSTIDSSISEIGTNGTLVGWGQQSENIVENVPRKLTLPIVRNQMCFPPSTKFRDTDSWHVFCAGTVRNGYAPCGGDSGSAFAIYANGAWFLRGVTSAARGDGILNNCAFNTYAIFTDAVQYRDWINQYMHAFM